jgi:Peptidase family S41
MPSTPALTRRGLLTALAATLAAPALRAQTAAVEITASEALRDLRLLKRAFEALHPGLHRYATPARLDAAFAQAEAAVASGTNRGQMVWLASTLAAQPHCGHTWVSRWNQRADVNGLLLQSADKLPFTLRWIEGRVLITGSVAPGIAAGSELLAIDGVPAAHIADHLLPALRADGQHAGAWAKRRSQLDSGNNGGAMDRLFPLHQPPQAGHWSVTVRDRPGAAPREARVAATTLAARDAALPPASAAWSLTVEGDTARLTLPTFAFWNQRFDWRSFIEQAFERIAGTRFCIVDQRSNEGGDSAIGTLLLQHLLQASHTVPAARVESAYERAPYELARFVDTWNFGFFDRTGKVMRGPGRNWLLPERAAQRIEPVARPYRGRTIVLVGPQNSSAGFLFARDLAASGAATLLGQMTAGNQRGLNGGELCWLTLPHSGVAVDIPLLATFNAGDPPDAGVAPQVLAEPGFADTQAGIDTEWQAALRLIERWRG